MTSLQRFIATCPEELKDIVMAELTMLGAEDVRPRYHAVEFKASPEVSYRLHLELRTPSRILRVVREFDAPSLFVVGERARKLPWPELFDVSRTFLVEGVIGDRGKGVPKSNDLSKAVKEGIWEAFRRKLGETPKVNLKEPQVVVVAFFSRGKVTLSIDSSGRTLHKRGYRLEGHPAPLKETMAAAVLNLAGYDGTQVLLDPLCGSGTIAIEAAMLALGKAPQIHRKRGEFGFEWLADFQKDLWRKAQEEARESKAEALNAPIYASDINPEFVALARQNALRARVEKHIRFATQSFFELKAPAPSGLIVSNLPYGERLKEFTNHELEVFYKKVGDTLKREFQGWRAALLVSDSAPGKLIGLKPTAKIPLLNGSLPCKLLIFDLYAGSHKEHKTALSAIAPSTSRETAAVRKPKAKFKPRQSVGGTPRTKAPSRPPRR